MIPPTYCEPCQYEVLQGADPWEDDKVIRISKDLQNRLEFIDWCVREESSRYEEGRETTANMEQEFQKLAEEWRSQTRNLSSMMKITYNRAYRQIVNMGPRVLPILLRELQRKPDLWFSALREITSENPVRPEHAGNVKKMQEAWVNWGKEHGYL
jgi:hypothetical protein